MIARQPLLIKCKKKKTLILQWLELKRISLANLLLTLLHAATNAQLADGSAQI